MTDKVKKAYQACSGCNSELTLSQYKQLLKEIEIEEAKEKASNKKKTTQKTNDE